MNARTLIENDDIKGEAMSNDFANELTQRGYEQVSPGYWYMIYDMPEWRKNNNDHSYALDSLAVHAADYNRSGGLVAFSVSMREQLELVVKKYAGGKLAEIDTLVRQFADNHKPVRWLSREFRKLGFK